MCGIVGMISKYPTGFNSNHRDIFTEMLIVDQLRGEDSTGVYGCHLNGAPDLVKGAMHSSEFVTTKAYHKFYGEMFSSYKMVVGHNRKATKGNIIGENAHPFNEGKITLVHNGTIRNQADLNKDVEVDSHAITHALNDNNAAQALESIDGAFALAWYDAEARTLNLARNKERPLSLAEFDDCYVFASEPGMIFWITARNGMKAKQYTDVPVGKILTFNMDDRKSYEEADYKDWVYKPPVVTSFPKAVTTSYPSANQGGTHSPTASKTALATVFDKNVPAVLQPRVAYGVGSTMLVQWVDSKDGDTSSKGVTLIGHPMYEDAAFVDENIFVNWWIPKLGEKEMDKYFPKNKDTYFECTVTSFSASRGSPTFFVREPKPITVKTSVNGRAFTVSRFADAIKDGCKECRRILPLKYADVPRMFLAPRADKTYRVICPDCWPAKAEKEKATVQ